MGRLNTPAVAALLLAGVAGLGFWLWHSGLPPFRLRQDGIYATGNGARGPAPSPALVDRPRLELPAPARVMPGYVRVTRVVDGDTIIVGDKERVRLIGIDTDEVPEDRVDPNSPGWRAALFVQDILRPDPQVKLQYDKERKDKYERTLAYVMLTDGRMLNEIIIKEGWARTIKIEPNTRYAGRFAELELEARDAGLGRWAR
jgi:micrococcal nuclease